MKNIIFDWKAALILVCAYIIANSLLAVAASALMFLGIFILNDIWFMLVSNVFILLAAIGAYDFFIMKTKGEILNFNMKFPKIIPLFMMIFLMFGMMLVADFSTQLIPADGILKKWSEFFLKQFELLATDPFALILMTVIFAPVLEEILFRGIIQKGLINNGMRPMKAVFLAALFFGIVHGNPWQFIGALLLGMVLGFSYFKTSSLLVPIILHALNNAISCYLILFQNTDNLSDLFNLPNYAILLAGIAILSIFSLIFKKYNKFI